MRKENTKEQSIDHLKSKPIGYRIQTYMIGKKVQLIRKFKVSCLTSVKTKILTLKNIIPFNSAVSAWKTTIPKQKQCSLTAVQTTFSISSAFKNGQKKEKTHVRCAVKI